jgi:hypothetical protein
MKKVLLLLALVLPAAACTAARAQVPPEDKPALVVPPVPPRAIEPLPAEPPPIEPVGDLPSAPANNTPRARPPHREGNRPPATDPKSEAKPPDPPPTDPAPTPAQPVPPLRTQGASESDTKQVLDTLDRAVKTLGKVDYQALKSDSRANYDNAKSFIKQAEGALKANDVASAKLLAERAENIAKLLAGG